MEEVKSERMLSLRAEAGEGDAYVLVNRGVLLLMCGIGKHKCRI